MTPPHRDIVATSHGQVAFLRAGPRGAPSVVLIHGSLVTADDMAFALMGSLAERYEVVAFDRPGHGGSDQTRDDHGSPWRQAAVLMEAWTALGLTRPVLVGHSFGGAVALCAAMAHAEALAGVVALAPICFPEPRLEHLLMGPRAVPGWGDAYARTLGMVNDVGLLPVLRNAMFLPQLMPDAYAAQFPFAWASRPCAAVANAVDAYAMFRALTLSAMRYGACEVPTTIIGGTRDLVVCNALHGRIVAQIMRAASYRAIDGMGHMAHHFCQDEIVEAVARMSGDTA